MDIRKHLKEPYVPWLNDAELQRRGGIYQGVISAVFLAKTRYTTDRQPAPTIRFSDGLCVMPNQQILNVLTELYGPETRAWVGQPVRIYRTLVTWRDASGRITREQWQKRCDPGPQVLDQEEAETEPQPRVH